MGWPPKGPPREQKMVNHGYREPKGGRNTLPSALRSHSEGQKPTAWPVASLFNERSGNGRPNDTSPHLLGCSASSLWLSVNHTVRNPTPKRCADPGKQLRKKYPWRIQKSKKVLGIWIKF